MPFSARSKKAPVPAHLQLQPDSLYLETSVCTEDSLYQFIAWKAKRKSHSIVPPWEEASGRVVIYSAPAGLSRRCES